MREWKPGDVAVSMVRGAPHIIFRTENEAGEHRWYDRFGSLLPDAEWVDGKEIRPLVVIDPENRDQAESLFRAWCDLLGGPRMSEQVDAMQGALRSLIEPPKPEEPGTWGVVEASCVHQDKRRQWMRHKDGNWYVVGADTKNNPDDWDSLIEPVIIPLSPLDR